MCWRSMPVSYTHLDVYKRQAQIKELYKDSWETIPGNSDTLLYLCLLYTSVRCR